MGHLQCSGEKEDVRMVGCRKEEGLACEDLRCGSLLSLG